MELEKYTTEQLNQCAFLSNIMSRMVKGLRFYTTCKLPSEPATVSWIHQETETPGAETRSSLPKAQQGACTSCSCSTCPSHLMRTQWFASLLRNPGLKNPWIFYNGLSAALPNFYPVGWYYLYYLDSKQTCPLLQWSHYCYFPGWSIIRISLKKKLKTEAVSAYAPKRYKVQQTHREWSPSRLQDFPRGSTQHL